MSLKSVNKEEKEGRKSERGLLRQDSAHGLSETSLATERKKPNQTPANTPQHPDTGHK